MFHTQIYFDIRTFGYKLLEIIEFKTFNKLTEHPVETRFFQKLDLIQIRNQYQHKKECKIVWL